MISNKPFFKFLKPGRARKIFSYGSIALPSRSIGANLAESCAKRNYPAHFISKLTDADGELQETSHWLSTAVACEYINAGESVKLQTGIEEIGKKLGKMMSMPEKFSRDN